ncbi:hypothetical protein FQN57_001938, partial [Myotisia sp. PD_48]
MAISTLLLIGVGVLYFGENSNVYEYFSRSTSSKEQCPQRRTGYTDVHRAATGATIQGNLDFSGQLEKRTSWGNTPLHVAVKYGQEDFIQTLHDRGADINALNNDNQTPLHLAACYGAAPSISKLLIDKGANIEAADKKNRTPVFYACRGDYNEIFQLLKSKGARLSLKDKKGKAPLDLVRNGDSKILNQLYTELASYLDTRSNSSVEKQRGEPKNSFYALPGDLQDLPGLPKMKARWSLTVDEKIEEIIEKKKNEGASFYNAARLDKVDHSVHKTRWKAFPKNFEKKEEKWEQADKRENQDEYCEWEVKRQLKDGKNMLKSVTFTTEFPEYFDFLSTVERGDYLCKLYGNQIVNGKVKLDEIFTEGKYNRNNRWNCRKTPDPDAEGCIAHMIRENNTLVEAADLVADATILRYDNGIALTDGAKLLNLLEVSKLSPNRGSDPKIVKEVNELARKGKFVTIANPVGIYIDEFEINKIKAPRGFDVKSMWRIERGSANRGVRATFTIPDGCLGEVMADNRIVEYGSHIANLVWIAVKYNSTDKIPNSTDNSTLQPLFTYIEGRHIKPTAVPPEQVKSELQGDPFGEYLAKTQNPAITLKDLISTLPDYTWVAFAADEGIGINFERTDVRVRVVIVCVPDHPVKTENPDSKMGEAIALAEVAFQKPTYTIVAVAPFDDPNNIHSDRSILQVASYNLSRGWFNFYDRERTYSGAAPGKWLYFGNSSDAFAPDTQGLGPFCGHPNGTLAMKELEEPWSHWHRPSLGLKLPPTHPMNNDKLFRDGSAGWYFGAPEHLAEIVKKGTDNWYNSRRVLDFGSTTDPKPVAERIHQWIAHICLNTSVCISSSEAPSDRKTGELKIPAGFFFNSKALALVIKEAAELEDLIEAVQFNSYERAMVELGLSTIQKFGANRSESDTIASNDEGEWVWKVITPCYDDIEGIRQLVDYCGIMPKNVIIALLMVDFCNPVFSARRGQLMRYMPSTLTFDAKSTGDDKYGFGNDLINAIEYAMKSLGLDQDTSPEAEFLKLARRTDLEEHSLKTIKDYIEGINKQLKTKDGIAGYIRVAESKRRQFRPHPRTNRPVHPLAEFDMSLPYASKIGAETWRMKKDGSVIQDEPFTK